MSNTIRLMTHNIWNCDCNHPAWEEKGEDCSAKARVGGLLRVYRETMPDIIGGQEVSALMADLLKQGFEAEKSDYALIWGRFTPIMYRTSKFELLDTYFCTYPEKLEGYTACFNDVKSKSYNLGVFKIKESGKIFIFATTHLWWMKSPKDNKSLETDGCVLGSDEAREYQISLLIDKVNEFRKKYNCPAIIVGDLNTNYVSKAAKCLFDNGFRHAHDIATDFAEESIGYHYCFPAGYKTEYYTLPFERAIDHIFLIGEPENAVKRFERYSPEYYFPISDHSPAYIDVEF